MATHAACSAHVNPDVTSPADCVWIAVKDVLAGGIEGWPARVNVSLELIFCLSWNLPDVEKFLAVSFIYLLYILAAL